MFNCFVTDPESHILFFDIEALIIELLSEEYSMMSPGSLEAAGLISQAEYLKVAALTQSASPDAHKKIAGKFFSTVFLFYFIINFIAYKTFSVKSKTKLKTWSGLLKKRTNTVNASFIV